MQIGQAERQRKCNSKLSYNRFDIKKQHLWHQKTRLQINSQVLRKQFTLKTNMFFKNSKNLFATISGFEREEQGEKISQ